MNSILKEEFRSTQPGTEPGADFFKIQFDMSTLYANKVLLHLVRIGYRSNDSEKERVNPDTESIPGTSKTPKVTDISERSIINGDVPIGDKSQDESRRKPTNNNGVGAKNRRKPIIVSPHRYNEQESEVFINTDDSEELEGDGEKPTKNNGIGAKNIRKRIIIT